MIRLLATVLIAIAAPAERAPPEIGPHPGPPVRLEVEIDAEQVVFRFTGEQTTLRQWFDGVPPETFFVDPMTADEVDAVRHAVAELMAELQPFTIDGAPVAPAIEAIAVPADEVTGYGVPALTFALRCDVDALPRTVGVVWGHWDGLVWFDAVKLPVQFRSFGEAQITFLTPEEPGHVWRPETFVPRVHANVAVVGAPPPPTIPLPLVSVAVAGALLLAFPFLVRARVGAAVLLALTGSAGLTAWIARHAAVVEVRDPLRPAIEVPPEPAAKELFDRLLRNVYAAFEARTESEIYDLLAMSVAPSLLDQMYGEVYESLILRGEGGAVCGIEKIEVLDGEVDVDAEYEPWDLVPSGREDDPFFRVRWKWQVHGVVSHWGHEHRRVNSYEASYIVRNSGDGWRIAACDILDQSRVDSDG